GYRSGQVQRPLAFTRDRLARIVEEDELLLEPLAGEEVMSLARETPGLAADVGQQRAVIADQGPGGGCRDPVRPLEVHGRMPLPARSVVRTEPRLLQGLPVHLELLAPPVRAGAEFPEDRVFPGGGRGHPPGTLGAPVIGDVAREDRLPLVEV